MSFKFPEFWSQNAIDIAIGNYLLRDLGPEGQIQYLETSLEEAVDRVVGALSRGGKEQGHFQNLEEGLKFGHKLKGYLTNQVGAFNSPVWFNLGASKKPQVSACFIQPIEDTAESIEALLDSEARLFRLGSGSGTNFSKIKNLIPVLERFDKSAQDSRSGGGHRRAAKMVCLDSDHPQILDFVQWKVKEERKLKSLMVSGKNIGMDSEEFKSISGQNSNNSIRLSDSFLKNAKFKAESSEAKLLDEIAKAAWESADPGVHYSDTITKWHTCKKSGPINASNPCSEFLFLDNSACNLASLNLIKFFTPDFGFDWNSFDEACSLFLRAQEILVDMGSYPTKEIEDISKTHRPLGLGFANLGGLLMAMGIPYDSELGFAWASVITQRLHFNALNISMEMAKSFGPFKAYSQNKESVLDVMTAHQKAALDLLGKNAFEVLSPILLAQFRRDWSQLLSDIRKNGLRNAQVTLIAPTGTIGLLMDCATLGIEPEFSLQKLKVLSGGGVMKILNSTVEQSLKSLGYDSKEREEILECIRKNGHPFDSNSLKPEHHPVFYTAVPPLSHPLARISVEGHLNMMAAVQPFLSGAISKTVNLPAGTTPEEIKQVFLKAHELGLKSISIYRDGSKAVQPLSCLDC